MVTTGRVSTFLARERTTQEAVVVYTFECAGTGAGDLSTATIIARFCALAPNPPGIIVKAGFDEPSSAAFLTTKMPDPVALKAWVGAYHSYGQPYVKAPSASQNAKPAGGPAGDETAELSASEVRAVLARTGMPAQPPPVENLSEDMGSGTAAFSLGTPEPAKVRPAGDFTRLFQEVNAFQPVPSSKPPASTKPTPAAESVFGERLGGSPLGGEKFDPPSPTKATSPPAEPSPGSFTREFMGISADKPAVPSPPGAAAPSQEPGAFTREFLGISQKDFASGDPARRSATASKSSPSPATSFESIFGSAASPSAGPAENQKGGAGEFTNFFRDPFDSPGEPQKSVKIQDFDSVQPNKPAAGDFTKMFGRGDIGGEPIPLPTLDPEPPAAAGSFTQMFGQVPSGSPVPAQKASESSQLGSATLGTSPNVRPTFHEPSILDSATPPTPPQRAATPAPLPDPFFSRTPAAASPPSTPSFMNGPGMSSPGMDGAGMNSSGSTTDVFRVPNADAPPVEQSPGGPSEFTVFLSRNQLNASLASESTAGSGSPAGSAQRPAFAPPAVPEPAFHFPPPPAPAVKLPAVPAPPGPASAPKPAGFWPLIVVLTVLLGIAGLLVMYFALKH